MCGNSYTPTTGKGIGRGRPQAYCGTTCSRMAARMMGFEKELQRWVECRTPTQEKLTRCANELRIRARLVGRRFEAS